MLDLGTTKAVCLAAALNEGGQGIRVNAFAEQQCRGVRRGVIHDIDAAAESAAAVVDEVEQELGRSVEDVVVNISGRHLQSVNGQGIAPISPPTRDIKPEDVSQVIQHSRQLMMPPDREQIMAIPREFRIDGQRGIAHPIGMSGGRLEVVTHIVTGQIGPIQNLERAVSRAGRKAELVVAQGLASGLGVATEEMMEQGCAVIDIGGSVTDLAIFFGGSVAWLASLPVGSLHITSDISQLLKCSPADAEALKREEGCALASVITDDEVVEVHQVDADQARPMQRRVLCEIIECRVREIGQLLWKEIERSGLKDMLGYGIIVTGGGSQLKKIDAAFSESMKHMKVKKGIPEVSGPYAAKLKKPTYSTAVGLAQYALGSDDQEFESVSGTDNWRNTIRTLKSLISKKN